MRLIHGFIMSKDEPPICESSYPRVTTHCQTYPHGRSSVGVNKSQLY